MAFELRNPHLFGIDLGSLVQDLYQGCADAVRWPIFGWLRPQETVRLRLPDGSTAWRLGVSAAEAAPGGARCVSAILLPDDLVLFRDLVLPDLVHSDLQQALALQVGEQAPFPVDDIAWGWHASPRDDGRLDVRVAIASQAHIGRYLASFDGAGGGDPEIWAGHDLPVVLRGFGEARRERRIAVRRAGILLALALLVILLLVLAATPFMLMRAQVFDAQNRYAMLVTETAQAVSDREALLKASARAAVVKAQLEGQVDFPRLLDRLTRVLPDTAHLNRLEISGHQVRMGGFAANAAELVETLGAQPGFRDVRTPTAISRSGDGRESFSVEFGYYDAEASQ